jgi:hypothetical protein
MASPYADTVIVLNNRPSERFKFAPVHPQTVRKYRLNATEEDFHNGPRLVPRTLQDFLGPGATSTTIDSAISEVEETSSAVALAGHILRAATSFLEHCHRI